MTGFDKKTVERREAHHQLAAIPVVHNHGERRTGHGQQVWSLDTNGYVMSVNTRATVRGAGYTPQIKAQQRLLRAITLIPSLNLGTRAD